MLKTKFSTSILFGILFFVYPSISYANYCNQCYSWNCIHERSENYAATPRPCGGTYFFIPSLKDYFNCNFSFTSYVDYLYWNVLEGETDYMIKNVPTGSNTVAAIGDLVSAEFDYNSGVRFGGILRLPCSNWGLEGNYTLYSTEGKDQHQLAANSTTIFNGTFSEQTSTSPTRVTSQIKINTDIWNIFIKREFSPCADVEFKFLMGATGAFLNQNWKFSYFGQNTD